MKKIMFLGAVFLLLVVISTSAMAFGIGVSFTGGGGRTTWNNIDTTRNEYFIGGTLVLDTCVANNRIFNYRLNLGYDHNLSKAIMINYYLYEANLDFYRVSMMHTLGFAIVRHEMVRLWLGPQIGLRYLNVETGTDPNKYLALVNPVYMILLPGISSVQDRFQLDIGAVLGLNIHLATFVSLTLEGGARYGRIFGTRTVSYGMMKVISDPSIEGFGSIGIMFRFNDEYVSSPKKNKVEIQTDKL